MSDRPITPTELGEAMLEYARRSPTINIEDEPGLPLPSMFPTTNTVPDTGDDEGLPLPVMTFDDVAPPLTTFDDIVARSSGDSPLTNNIDEEDGLPLPVMTY